MHSRLDNTHNNNYNNYRSTQNINFTVRPKSTNNKFKDVIIPKIQPFEYNDTNFPIIGDTILISHNTELSYLNAINEAIETLVIEETQIDVKPGWVKITFDKKDYHKINITCNNDDIKNRLHNDQIEWNCQMIFLLESLVLKHVSYRQKYDNIYGEGAYNEIYYNTMDNNDDDDDDDDDDCNDIYEDLSDFE